MSQFKNTSYLLFGNIFIKGINFSKQIILAFYLGVSGFIDIFLVCQVIPLFIKGILGGLSNELLPTIFDEDKEEESDRIILFYIILLFIVSFFTAIIYYYSSRYLFDLWNLDINKIELYNILIIIFSIDIPIAVFVASSQNLFLLKNRYKQFMYRIIISELIGIFIIILLLGPKYDLGIIAFAYGILSVSVINFLLFILIIPINLKSIFSSSSYAGKNINLFQILLNHSKLFINACIGQSFQIFERSMVSFLSIGYLSTLSYARTITGLPNNILISSVLKIIYIEQSKRYKKSYQKFSSYTSNTFSLFIKIHSFFLIFFILVSPSLVSIIYNRGAIKTEDLMNIIIIIQILNVGLFSLTTNNFFSNSYILMSEYKKLTYLNILKLISFIVIVLLSIENIFHSIPIAFSISNLIFTTLAFIHFYKIGIIRSSFIDKIQLIIIVLLSIIIPMIMISLVDFFISFNLVNNIIYIVTILLIFIYSFYRFTDNNDNEILYKINRGLFSWIKK